MTFVEVAGLLVVLITAGSMIAYQIRISQNGRPELRPIPAFINLKKAIGLAVENGSRIHVTLGNSSLTQPASTSALAGLATLERIGHYAGISDKPPLATSGDGGVMLLSQDSLKAVYRSLNESEVYDSSLAYMPGITPLSYIAGTLPITTDEDISTHVIIGNFGSEVALLTEAANSEGAFNLAASGSLSAQSVLYASAEEPLIGEELFAAPAFLEGSSAHFASLTTQDILRWGIIAVLLGGAVLKLVGIL